MAATDQLYFFFGGGGARAKLQIFLWAKKSKTFKSEIIQILLSHSPRYGDVQVNFRVLLKFKMAAMDKLDNFFGEHFWGAFYNHITCPGNVRVILLKFKIPTTSQLFKFL